MNQEQREQVEQLDKLIRKKEELKELAEIPAFKKFRNTLAEIRVDAMDQAIMEGDTTDQKAFARCFGVIINFMDGLDKDYEITDLLERREILKSDIEMVERQRRERAQSMNQGNSAIL